MRSLLITISLVLLIACKKEQAPVGSFSEASYKITVTGKWQAPSFSVPPSAHFTYFTGAVHSIEASIWQAGTLSSTGLKAVAETGNQFPLFEEVDGLIASKKALAQINIPPPDVNASISRTVYCNSNYPLFSFASMIAPSPDWFVGVSNLVLFRNNEWLTDTTIQLYAYDAGTEEGDVFGYNNPTSNPAQPVQLLTPSKATVLANGNASLSPIAQVRILKQ